jgi:ligand-binding SRPBCC domain-containing protein
MPVIKLTTVINAPIERCFLLSLSVDLHKASVAQTNETAIAGISSGIMTLHDTVTWQARHFGFNLRMTSHIPVYQKPAYFVSEMQKGPFKKLHHQHRFTEADGHTVMTDVFELQAPLGILGRLAERLFLVAYMNRFLLMRNRYLKQVAEGDGWKTYL